MFKASISPSAIKIPKDKDSIYSVYCISSDFALYIYEKHIINFVLISM